MRSPRRGYLSRRGERYPKGSPFGEGEPSPRECPTPPPLLFEAGAGKTKCSGILKCCRNAFGYWKWVRQQLRGYTRGDCFSKNDWIAPARVGNGSFRKRGARWLYRGNAENRTRAGRGTKVSAGVARDDCNVVTQRISPARSRGTDSSGSRGGAGATNEEKQKAFVPPPAGRAGRVPRESFREKCRISLAGFASRGGSRRPAAKRVARLWAPPAPFRRASRGSAGGGFPGFADFTTWNRSALA